MKFVSHIPVWGEPINDAVAQLATCMKHPEASRGALMADHHLGYSMPIGGVIAYSNAVSPSAVGFDVGCGNKAAKLNVSYSDVKGSISSIMDDVTKHISFGVGRKNKEEVDFSSLENDPVWEIPVVGELKLMAKSQLGTVGSGNHYVDIFRDENDVIWVGVHFGSRGLGHKIATHYIKAGGGTDGMFVEPVVLDTTRELGKEYIAAMRLAGRYAYAGRDWVCAKVASILGAQIVEEVHANHNFAWEEEHFGSPYWVIRKGATPAFPGQKGFIGGSMAEPAVIIEGVDSLESKTALYSTVHGAGRVMSRVKAAGKFKYKAGKRIRVTEGEISSAMMAEWVSKAGVELRGAGTDESPHCYKRLKKVLTAHENTIKILHTLTPIGVAMAGENEVDPFKD